MLSQNIHFDKTFSMSLPKEGNIERIITTVNFKKGPGSDSVPQKIVIRSLEYLHKPLAKIINATITQQKFFNLD